MTAVIAAAGSGERLGAGGPKAFVELAGRSLVEWSIEAMRAAPSVAAIVVACPSGMRLSDPREGPSPGEQPIVPEAPEESASGGDPAAPGLIQVDGGATRARSVANALDVVETDLVAIHDAARPLVTAELVDAVAATLRAEPDAAGAIAAAPVTDTIKRSNLPNDTRERADPPFSPQNVEKGGLVANRHLSVESTLDRAHLWAAQTPQVFRVDALRQALEASEDPDAATDEAMLVESAGGRVLIHPSSPENLKVTTPLDLRVAELLLAERPS